MRLVARFGAASPPAWLALLVPHDGGVFGRERAAKLAEEGGGLVVVGLEDCVQGKRISLLASGGDFEGCAQSGPNWPSLSNPIVGVVVPDAWRLRFREMDR